ncbi:hypothetical protein AAVH_14729 [Aphelenchoides avenae]|nr:hypothetical protein AAVH_14729 [Aphelenchus avenae]
MAGNTGLWLGYTMISLTECLLIAIQIGLWVCRCPKELPEVPSCRYRNFMSDEEEEKIRENGGLDESTAPSHKNELTLPKFSVVRKVSSWHGMAPKNFNNSLYDDDSADFRSSLPDLEAMRRKWSNSTFELVIPVIAESCYNEEPVQDGYK